MMSASSAVLDRRGVAGAYSPLNHTFHVVQYSATDYELPLRWHLHNYLGPFVSVVN